MNLKSKVRFLTNFISKFTSVPPKHVSDIFVDLKRGTITRRKVVIYLTDRPLQTGEHRSMDMKLDVPHIA